MGSAPFFTSILTKYPNGTAYDPALTYGFQINATDLDGNMANATFESNFTSTFANFTYSTTPNVQNTTKDIFWINFTQPQFKGAGTYQYRWILNDTGNAINVTEWIYYTVNAAGQSISLTGITNNTYPYSVTPVCTGNVTSNLYRNGSSAVNNSAIQLGAAGYLWTCNTTADSNYTFATTSVVQSIAKATPAFSSSVTSPITYGTASDYAGSESNAVDSDCSYVLQRNGTQIATGSSVSDATVLAARAYNYSYFTAGCTNFTAGNIQNVLNVAQNSSGTIKSWSLNDTYMNFNESAQLLVTADSVDSVIAMLQASGGHTNFTLSNNGTHYGMNLTKAHLNSSWQNATLVNVTRLYFGGSNYTQSSNATALQLDYARTADLDDPAFWADFPDPITNSIGSAVTIWATYNTTEGTALTGSACAVDIFGGIYNMAYSAGRYEATISTFGRAVDTYLYVIRCTNSSYQNQTCTNSSQTITVTEGGVGTSPGGGGGGGGGGSVVTANFTLEPEELTIITSPGSEALAAGFGKDYSFRFCSQDVSELKLQPEAFGEYGRWLNITGARPAESIVWSSPGVIGWVKVAPLECVDISVRFAVPSDAPEGEYAAGVKAMALGTATEKRAAIKFSVTQLGVVKRIVDAIRARLEWGVDIRTECPPGGANLCIVGEREMSVPYVGAMLFTGALAASFMALRGRKQLRDSKGIPLFLSFVIAIIALMFVPVGI